MGLVISQNQGRPVAFVGWDFQGQIDPSKRNWGKCWEETRAVSSDLRFKSSELFVLQLLQNELFASLSPGLTCNYLSPQGTLNKTTTPKIEIYFASGRFKM